MSHDAMLLKSCSYFSLSYKLKPFELKTDRRPQSKFDIHNLPKSELLRM
jgi:hypothetical protein